MGKAFIGVTRISTTIGSTAASHGIGATTITGSRPVGATLVLRSGLTGDLVTISFIAT